MRYNSYFTYQREHLIILVSMWNVIYNRADMDA